MGTNRTFGSNSSSGGSARRTAATIRKWKSFLLFGWVVIVLGLYYLFFFQRHHHHHHQSIGRGKNHESAVLTDNHGIQEEKQNTNNGVEKEGDHHLTERHNVVDRNHADDNEVIAPSYDGKKKFQSPSEIKKGSEVVDTAVTSQVSVEGQEQKVNSRPAHRKMCNEANEKAKEVMSGISIPHEATGKGMIAWKKNGGGNSHHRAAMSKAMQGLSFQLEGSQLIRGASSLEMPKSVGDLHAGVLARSHGRWFNSVSPGYHCFALYDSSRNCFAATTSFIVTDKSRGGSEYATPNSLVKWLPADVLVKDSKAAPNEEAISYGGGGGEHGGAGGAGNKNHHRHLFGKVHDAEHSKRRNALLEARQHHLERNQHNHHNRRGGDGRKLAEQAAREEGLFAKDKKDEDENVEQDNQQQQKPQLDRWQEYAKKGATDLERLKDEARDILNKDADEENVKEEGKEEIRQAEGGGEDDEGKKKHLHHHHHQSRWKKKLHHNDDGDEKEEGGINRSGHRKWLSGLKADLEQRKKHSGEDHRVATEHSGDDDEEGQAGLQNHHAHKKKYPHQKHPHDQHHNVHDQVGRRHLQEFHEEAGGEYENNRHETVDTIETGADNERPVRLSYLVPKLGSKATPLVAVAIATMQGADENDWSRQTRLPFHYKSHYDARSILVDDNVDIRAGKGSFWIVAEGQEKTTGGLFKQYPPGMRRLNLKDLTVENEDGGDGGDNENNKKEAPAGGAISSPSMKGSIKGGVKFSEDLEEFSTVKTATAFITAANKAAETQHRKPCLIRVTSTIRVESPHGAKGLNLICPKGSVLLVDSGAQIILEKYVTLSLRGLPHDPVSVTAANGEGGAGGGNRWDGFVLHEGSALEAESTIFSFAGGNLAKREPGTGTHIKNALPVFSLNGQGAKLSLKHSAVVNSKGPGVGAGAQTEVLIEHTLFQDLAQGGECVECTIDIKYSQFIDIPFTQRKFDFVDKDNDGFYFRGGKASMEWSVVMNTLDDCVDSASSKKGALSLESSLTIKNSWLTNCQHEGLALSASQGTTKVVTMEDSVVSHVQQGVEVGYSPSTHTATVSGTKFYHNAISIRYGDNYPKEVEGNLLVKECTFTLNQLDVLNYVKKDEQLWRKERHDDKSTIFGGDPPASINIKERRSAAASIRDKNAENLVLESCVFGLQATGHHSHVGGEEAQDPAEGQQEGQDDATSFDLESGMFCGVKHFVSKGNRRV